MAFKNPEMTEVSLKAVLVWGGCSRRLLVEIFTACVLSVEDCNRFFFSEYHALARKKTLCCCTSPHCLNFHC